MILLSRYYKICKRKFPRSKRKTIVDHVVRVHIQEEDFDPCHETEGLKFSTAFVGIMQPMEIKLGDVLLVVKMRRETTSEGRLRGERAFITTWFTAAFH